MTDNLGLGRIAAGMSLDAIGAKANDMVGALDAATTNPSTVTIDDTNTLTLTAAQFIGSAGFQVDPAGSPPSSASTLNVPAENAEAETLKRGLFVVINGLAQTLAVQVSGQSLTAPVLAAGTWGLFFMNGVDVRQLTGGAVGGGGDGTFLGLTDTPATYVEQAGKIVRVKGDASGLEFVQATESTGASDWKEPARAATTADITLSGEQTIDGVAVVTGERVLVQAQTDGTEDGIYVADSGAWSRADDFDTDAEVTSGLMVYVEEGTVNGGSIFALTTPNPIVLDTTALTFATAEVSTSVSVAKRVNQSSYTLILSDASKWLQMTHGTAKTLTIPPHSDVAIPINSEIIAQWSGNSAVNALTIAAGSGVTLHAPFGLVLPAQHSWARLKKTGKNQWTVQVPTAAGGSGDMAAATYDPQAIGDDAFDRANHTGTQTLATISDAGDAAALDVATAAETRSAAADKVLTAARIEDASALVALTDGANISLDWDAGINRSVTLGGNRTLDNPTNGQPGTWRTVIVTQDGTGSRTLAFDTQYAFPGGTAPTLTTDAAAVDVLSILCVTTSLFYVFSALDLS